MKQNNVSSANVSSQSFWPALRHILSEYGDFLSIFSPNAGKKLHQKKAPNTGTFHAVVRFCTT